MSRQQLGRLSPERRGFTLVEVAVSVAILGSVITSLLVARGRAIQACNMAAETITAARLCASQAAALRGRVIGEGAGEFTRPPGYSWYVMRSTLPEDAPEKLEAFTIRVVPPSGNPGSIAAITLWLPATEDPEEDRQ